MFERRRRHPLSQFQTPKTVKVPMLQPLTQLSFAIPAITEPPFPPACQPNPRTGRATRFGTGLTRTLRSSIVRVWIGRR